MSNAISFFKPLLDDRELNKIEHDIANIADVGGAGIVDKLPAGPQKEYLSALLALCRGQILDARVKINSAVQKFGHKPYFSYLLGKIAATKQQTDDAIWFFCMSISLQPDLPANYGELSYQIARPGRADFVDRLASHDQVLKHFSPLCFFARAQCAGDEDNAHLALTEGAALHPDLLGIWVQLAILNDQRVRRERALKFFQRSEYLNPSDRSFEIGRAHV